MGSCKARYPVVANTARSYPIACGACVKYGHGAHTRYHCGGDVGQGPLLESSYAKNAGGNHACGHGGNTAVTYTVARGAFTKDGRDCNTGDKCGG